MVPVMEVMTAVITMNPITKINISVNGYQITVEQK